MGGNKRTWNFEAGPKQDETFSFFLSFLQVERVSKRHCVRREGMQGSQVTEGPNWSGSVLAAQE